jgi:phytoene dehydrogenase-like protein
MAALAMSQSTRRDFIAALLGAPFAAAACSRRAARLPDGELLLPGKSAGHRLRDGTWRAPAPNAALRSVQVAIVGGGVAGLAAAWWLERRGLHDFLVLELDDVLGGTSRSGSSPLTAYPWGAHYIVAPQPHQASLIELLRELAALEVTAAGATVAAEQAACREPEERLFYRGRWYDGLYLHAGASRSDQEQLRQFQQEIAGWVAFRDARGRRAFTLPSSAASDAAEVTSLDRQSFASWLDARGLDSPRLRWLMNYACRDDYGLTPEDTSAWAGIAYFAARIAQPGAEPEPVITWPEGNGRLVSQLAKTLGPRLALGHAVGSVRGAEAGVEILAESAQGGLRLRARHAIVATPGHIARRIVAGLAERPAPAVTLDRGAWAVANLHLDERPPARSNDVPLAWDNVFHDSPSLGYVVATHQQGRDHGPSVFTWYYPFTGSGAEARRSLDGAGRDEWAALALADLGRAHPDIAERCRRVDVAYWGHGMVRPRVGSVFDPALRAARLPLGAVHFAVSELSGWSLFEEALDHGVRAAEEVLSALGHAV